ncbi:MAG: glutamine--fructose-6-phosphate transaminase (isomerizing) [Candidatus Bipolaricaulota bacterium]
MCGIVGYTGNNNAAELLVNRLKTLEYRGYDSAGIAVLNEHKLDLYKSKGSLDKLEKKLEDNGKIVAGTGIGHTRWATHGKPSDYNSHPHSDCTGKITIVHNGIIENYQVLKEELLRKGHKFNSKTDSEVVVHLLEDLYDGDMVQALIEVDKLLEGSYAIVAISEEEPETIYGLKKDSPLVAGIGNKENYLASDIPALLSKTKDFYIFEDDEIAKVDREKIEFYDLDGKLLEKAVFEANWDADMVDKKGYDHFMLKEINEQPDVARRIMADRFTESDIDLEELEEILAQGYEKVMITACGTAYHSGLIGRFLIEEFADIPVDVEVASELRYKKNFIDENTLMIVVSQSGETADTLAALRLAKKQGARVVALTNAIGSSVDRESDASFQLMAGPEISVASTKAYVAMVLVFYLLALKLGKLNNNIPEARFKELIAGLKRLPYRIEETTKEFEGIAKEIASSIKDYQSIFFIGRNIDYALALEGALKLKEISYIHAEAHPAGELKHGSLALIENGVPVFAITTRENTAMKTLSNIEEVMARGGQVNLITAKNIEYDKIEVANKLILPEIDNIWSSVLAAIPLQLIAYYTALELDRDIDKPRNLAKSVTVE